jgi:rod shape-determining protein MreD
MRWVAFAILLYVVIALQSAATPFVAVNSIRPDLMVIVAVHYALAARAYDALLACWFIGLAVDLVSMSYRGRANVGLHALTLSLLAMPIVKVRSFVFRDSIFTQLVFTFLAKLALDLIVGMHMMWAIQDWSRWGEVAATAVYAAIYTAVLAPYGHWFLRRLRGALGIGASHTLRVR